ncbi:hypothetical protein EOA79_01460 [Mesorhizobium sp. M1A.F.Ca.IN.020.03.2.1]|uniref:hypothetical protein n=1 Tax=Mesorhizobium sp. M1A.F.Ca.IN.020.03.2.1 TaxID=2496769 RepID=UPI000FD48642|nr:hypothetical protein [Mesorhizobium sp. M1A.F.Ca.IN.020.03.2.1]RUV08163.1 hypothetical protein EOA79_01460 [Mesorhizobium sp. M1A.F.Ca.IN.020.03.2.1]
MALKIPADLNETFVNRHAEIDPTTGAPVADPVFDGLANAVRLAREQAGMLANLEKAAMADKTMTPEANVVRVASAASKTGERVAAQLDVARTRAMAEIANIEKRTSSPPPPKDSVALSIESDITRALASMGDKERADAIAQAKAQGDETVIAAILRRPAMVSGLGEAQLEGIRHAYRQHFHSADYARLQRLQRAVEAMEKSGRLFVGIIKSAMDTPFARQAAIAAREADAAAAHASGA